MEIKNKYGFQYSEPKDGDFVHGDHLLGTLAINPTGQWDLWLPEDEFQNRGYETYSCVTQATLNCAEILQRKKYTDPTNYSDRFLATMSGTKTKGGNDFNTVAETFRKNGCCQETDWPFDAVDYDAFYTTPSDKIIRLSQTQFANDNLGHSWITDTSPSSLKDALTYSPLSLSVHAWGTPDAQGIYHRTPGETDNHAITVYGYEEGEYWKVFDSYAQTHKKLAWDYGFGMGKRWTLDRVIATNPNPDGWINWTIFIQYIRNLLKI